MSINGIVVMIRAVIYESATSLNHEEEKKCIHHNRVEAEERSSAATR